MEINVGYLLQGIILLLVGVVIWLIKKNTDKVNELDKSMGVVQHIVSDVGEDHDKIIVIEHDQKIIKKDLNAIGSKVRDLEDSTA
jgi:flagellar biogenesis protein FliO